MVIGFIPKTRDTFLNKKGRREKEKEGREGGKWVGRESISPRNV